MSFCPRIPSRRPCYPEVPCLLRLLLTMAATQSFHAVDDLDSFEEYWSGVLQDARLLDFGFVFMIRLEFGFFGEEDHRGKVSFSSVHIKGTYYHHDLWLLILTLIIWLKSCLSGFSTVKWFSLSPLPSHVVPIVWVAVCPPLRSEELRSPLYSVVSMSAYNSGILHRRMSLLPCVLIYSVIYLYQHGLVDIYFTL